MFNTDAANAAIKRIIEAETRAWNNGDAQAFSQFMAEDVSFTNILGMHFTGRQYFQDRHQQILEGPFKNTVLQQEIVSIQFIQSGVALVDTLGLVSGCRSHPLPGVFVNEKGQLGTRLLQVMVGAAEDWHIAAYHNVDIKAGIPVPE